MHRKKSLTRRQFLQIGLAAAGGLALGSVQRMRAQAPTSSIYLPITFRNTTPANTGVAPLSVHFAAELIASSPSERSFHHYAYTWNFGDEGAGVWGTNGKSKNEAKGPVATHIYEQPGTYTATLTVRDGAAVMSSRSFSVVVTDPDAIYTGESTICVTDTAHNDFTGAPAGARLVATDDLATITQYATAGSRILFRRGCSWTTPGLTWPNNSGPVTIGAFGEGVDPDALGIYANAPQITVTSETFLPLDRKQDWRIMDLHLTDPTRSYGSMGGAMEMQRDLFLRLKIEGFNVCLGWSHWNTGVPMAIDQMVIASCDLSDADVNVAYVGSERLALLGNVMYDARASHVLRVWQAYQSVISHNIISGASLDNTNGRHALKLHGPGGDEYGTPIEGTGRLENLTQFSVVSDNIFGSSGPWPVCLGPQDAGADERLSDLIFERNRLTSQYGAQSSTPVQIALRCVGTYFTVRNNIFDGSGSSNDYTALILPESGAVPPSAGMEIYNNTIYRQDNSFGNGRSGVQISAEVTGSVIRNNLVSFPNATVPTFLLQNDSADLVESNNLMTNTPGFVDPDNADPLQRDFRVQSGSPAVNQGTQVPVFDDFAGNARPNGVYDIGSFEA